MNITIAEQGRYLVLIVALDRTSKLHGGIRAQHRHPLDAKEGMMARNANPIFRIKQAAIPSGSSPSRIKNGKGQIWAIFAVTINT
jgi:hypothetical protein